MEDSVAGEGSVCEGRVCERVGKTLPSASKKWGGAGSVLGVGEGRREINVIENTSAYSSAMKQQIVQENENENFCIFETQCWRE